MKLEMYNHKDHYSIIKEWWEKQDWSALPKDALPKTGFVGYKDDTPVACGFLYNTDSSIAVLEWIVGNPDIDYEVRGEGLDKVIEALILTAEYQGKRFISTTTDHKRLINRYEKHKFKVTDKNVSNLLRSL